MQMSNRRLARYVTFKVTGFVTGCSRFDALSFKHATYSYPHGAERLAHALPK